MNEELQDGKGTYCSVEDEKLNVFDFGNVLETFYSNQQRGCLFKLWIHILFHVSPVEVVRVCWLLCRRSEVHTRLLAGRQTTVLFSMMDTFF